MFIFIYQQSGFLGNKTKIKYYVFNRQIKCVGESDGEVETLTSCQNIYVFITKYELIQFSAGANGIHMTYVGFVNCG
jgi:hypothetical protein